jgi:hypothetical protein
MTGGGFGGGSWGDVPWGGGDQLLSEESCDLLLFDAANIDSILATPAVEPTGDPLQFVLGTGELEILSGDSSDPSFPTDDAYLTSFPSLDSTFTVEINATFESLPNDFTDVSARHVMFGVADANGPCAAVFLSKVGLAYAGAVHHTPGSPSLGTLVLDSTLQVIPGTSGYTPLGTEMTYRLAVSSVVGAVYLYATPTASLGVTGHQLVAILPVVDASDLTVVPSDDHILISVRGTSVQPSRLSLSRWCLSSFFDVPNIAPVANAGQDQAVRACSIALLDGSASTDLEGSPLLYSWRLIDAPPTSSFATEATDGATFPILPFDGFTSRFHSSTLENLEAAEPIQLGSVLLIDGSPRSVVGKGVDGNGFYLQTAISDLPDNLSSAPFKLLRQNGLSSTAEAVVSFFADIPGFYKFDLTVFDGSLYSSPAVVILNVLESVLPRGCIPDTSFIFSYISDFWRLVEGAQTLNVVWSGLAQVAATELYTLWQHEYSKSLKDVQRTIARRWLHYDLLLAEPVPELTKLRVLWSGVQSGQVALVGDPGVVGTSLVLTSPIFEEDAVIDWVGSTTAGAAALELQNRLLEFDSRFSVTTIPDRSGTFLIIRINAPFPFTVSESSNDPLFTAGDSNGTLTGTGAAGGGAKTYVVDRSLDGLGIREDDLLVIDGVGYRITRVLNGAPTDSDSFDQQRLSLKDELPVPAGTSWTIASTVKSQLLDFFHGLVSEGDEVFFETSDLSGTAQPEIIQTKAIGVSEALPSVLAIDIAPLGAALAGRSADATIFLAKCVRRTYLPVTPLLKDLPVLQEHIVIDDDEATLRRNVDFFLETYRGAPAIRFVTGESADVWENGVPPERLWAEYSFIDNNPVIEANFGIPAGFTLDDLASLTGEIDYLSAVSGLWYAFFNGPRPDNIRIGAQIFLGLPFAEEAGAIEEIRNDFSATSGRILIRDLDNEEIVRSYSYPNALELETNPATGSKYVVGDQVKQFAPLVEGVEIVDYVKDPTWFKGLLAQGAFFEVQKYHRFSIRVDSEVFNLSSLLLVRKFVLTLRPTYTYPVIVVALTAEQSDLSILDDITLSGKLVLNDSLCSEGATMFDDAQPGTDGGAWWNQFDYDGTAPAPTYPTPDAGIPWAFDKEYLCPDDFLVANLVFDQAALGPPVFDTFLTLDSNVTQAVLFSDVSPFSIPAPVAELTIPSTTVDTAVFNGAIKLVRLLVTGSGPGAFATDYELVVEINGVDSIVVPFDATDPVFEVESSVNVAVTLGDTLAFKIREPAATTSPGVRTPDWASVSALVTIEDGAWIFGGTIPAGTYFIQIPL